MPTNNQPSYRVPSVCLPVSDDECKASQQTKPETRNRIGSKCFIFADHDGGRSSSLTCLLISNRRKKIVLHGAIYGSAPVPFRFLSLLTEWVARRWTFIIDVFSCAPFKLSKCFVLLLYDQEQEERNGLGLFSSIWRRLSLIVSANNNTPKCRSILANTRISLHASRMCDIFMCS